MSTWAQWDARRRALATVVAAAVLLALGAWIASLAIESPREAAASAGAPAPSLITVPVQNRKVGEELVTRGLVVAGQTLEVVNPAAGRGADRALISGHVPRPGTEIDHGDVIVEVSGRPVLALEGDVPAYRGLRLGDTGPDVKQLNAALAAAGLKTDKTSRAFTEQTRDAVVTLYRAHGYSSAGNLPSTEVAFVSALPASVVQVSAALGADLEKASIKLAAGALRVTASFPAAQAALVQDGAKVVVSSEVLVESVEATVKATAPLRRSTEEPDAEGQVAFSIVPDKPLGSEWAGQDVKVRIVSATTGTEVLAVPVTAVVADAAGETEVVVVDRGATTIADSNPRRVRVRVGAVGGGWAEVTPIDGARLAVGDPVQLSAPAR